MKHPQIRSVARGFLLIEALVALLIFSLGILGMIAMGGTAIGAQSDAHFRTDAARLAEDIAGTISMNVDRSSAVSIANSLNGFQHQPGGTTCAYAGTPSANSLVTDWVSQVKTAGPGLPGLPGAFDAGQQILISNGAGGYNQIEVTVCWKAPNSPAGTFPRHHTFITYIN